MNEIETTLESAPAAAIATRRSVVRRLRTSHESGGADADAAHGGRRSGPAADDATCDLRDGRTQAIAWQ